MKRVLSLIGALLLLAVVCLPAAAETVNLGFSGSSVVVEAKNNPGLPGNVNSFNAKVDGVSTMFLLLPSVTDLSRVTVTFGDKSTRTLDMRQTHTFSFKDVSSTRTYRVVALQSDLPSVYLNVDESKGTIYAMNASNEHTTQCYGKMTVSVSAAVAKQNGWATSMTGAMSMRGRGNSTWKDSAAGKKPYQVKLDAKADVLGMGAAKTWVLLAQNDDRSMIRNALSLELAKAVGCPYTPEFRFVDFYMNGSYHGCYLLCEKVQVNEQRVNINELNKNGKTETTTNGGYLLEYDARSEKPFVDSAKELTGLNNLDIKSPDKVTAAQKTYITDFITNLHNALIAKSGKNSKGKYYTSYIDSVSAGMAAWVNEIVKNADFGYGSTFMYKDTGTVLYSGPVWDFDIAMGAAVSPIAANSDTRHKNLASPTGWWLRENKSGSTDDIAVTYAYYLRQHSDYQQVDAQIYGGNVRAAMLKLPERVAYYRNILKKSAQMNFIRWTFPATRQWMASSATNWEEEMTFLSGWLTQRTQWIDTQMLAAYPNVASMKRLTVPVKTPVAQTTTTTAKKVITTTTAKKNSSGTVAPTTKQGAAGTVVVTDTAGHAVTNQNGQTVTAAAPVVTDANGQTVTAANGAPVTVAAEAVTTVTTGQTTAKKQSAAAPATLLFAIGGVVLVAAAAGVTVFFIRKRRRPQETPAFRTKEDTEAETADKKE